MINVILKLICMHYVLLEFLCFMFYVLLIFSFIKTWQNIIELKIKVAIYLSENKIL